MHRNVLLLSNARFWDQCPYCREAYISVQTAAWFVLLGVYGTRKYSAKDIGHYKYQQFSVLGWRMSASGITDRQLEYWEWYSTSQKEIDQQLSLVETGRTKTGWVDSGKPFPNNTSCTSILLFLARGKWHLRGESWLQRNRTIVIYLQILS